MMYLEDVFCMVESFGLAEEGRLYMGKLDVKKEHSIGIYNSKHERVFKTAIGGPACESYGVKYVTFLVHGSRSVRDTERLAAALFEKLRDVREMRAGRTVVKFIQLLTDGPVDVGADDAGICEMVAEAALIYAKNQ